MLLQSKKQTNDKIMVGCRMMPNVLPTEDIEVSLEAKAQFEKNGITIRNDVRVEGILKTSHGVEVPFPRGTQKKL